MARGRNMADAAKEHDVQHLIWSTLPNVAKITSGRLNSVYWDGKAEIDDYIRTLGLPATSLWLPFYFENLLHDIQLVRCWGFRRRWQRR